MRFVYYTYWLAEQSFSVLLYFWGISAVLVIGLIASLVFQTPIKKGNWQLRYWGLLAPSVVTVLILCWGALMAHPTSSDQLAPAWPSYIVLGLLVVQIVVCIAVVFAMKPFRVFAAFAAGLQLWYGVASAFTAGMSVTGDWL
jgi:hypothetical protein